MEWSRAPHVAVVLNASSGHTIPFLQFSRRLAAEGVLTTVVTSDRHVRELEKLVGLKDLSAQGEPLRLLGLRDKKEELSHDEWRRRVCDVPEERLAAIQLLEEVIKDVASPQSWHIRGVPPATPPLCILYDMFGTWAAEAAANLHIEKHLLYVSPAACLSIDIQSKRLFEEGRTPITKGTRDMIVTDIPGVPQLHALDFPSTYLHDPVNYAHYLDHHRRFQRADVILVNSFYDIDKPALDAMRNQVIGTPDVQVRRILEIGPLLLETQVNDNMMKQESDPCILWLNTRAPHSVLYISFGSFSTHGAPQLLELALGLEASNCSFLWLARPPDAGRMSAASGSPVSMTEFLPPGFEERIKDRGKCYSGWAPQARILTHPAVGGFLSHCGWNSTLEAVWSGIPLLAWPITAEQHLNRRLLVDEVNVAIDLNANPYTREDLEGDLVRPTRFVPKEEIEKKVRRLMQDAEGGCVIRTNMQTLQAKAREAVIPGGSSRQNLETYVQLLHDANSH